MFWCGSYGYFIYMSTMHNIWVCMRFHFGMDIFWSLDLHDVLQAYALGRVCLRETVIENVFSLDLYIIWISDDNSSSMGIYLCINDLVAWLTLFSKTEGISMFIINYVQNFVFVHSHFLVCAPRPWLNRSVNPTWAFPSSALCFLP